MGFQEAKISTVKAQNIFLTIKATKFMETKISIPLHFWLSFSTSVTMWVNISNRPLLLFHLKMMEFLIYSIVLFYIFNHLLSLALNPSFPEYVRK